MYTETILEDSKASQTFFVNIVQQNIESISDSFLDFQRLCKKLPIFPYRIVQNGGKGKLWQIWQIQSNLPKFYPPKFISLNFG